MIIMTDLVPLTIITGMNFGIIYIMLRCNITSCNNCTNLDIMFKHMHDLLHKLRRNILPVVFAVVGKL